MKKNNPKSKRLVSPSILKVVENAIKHGDCPSRGDLRSLLPDKFRDTTINQALRSLESANKIMFDKKGSIVWTGADNKRLKGLLSRATELR